MFDIGFFELVVVGVVALIVLGPERLPHAARMTGAWIGKVRRTTLAIREELEREVNAQELQQRLKQEMERTGLNEAKESLAELETAMRKNLLEQEAMAASQNPAPAHLVTTNANVMEVAPVPPALSNHAQETHEPKQV
jgi:sec-independent protein translocase protein TatB